MKVIIAIISCSFFSIAAFGFGKNIKKSNKVVAVKSINKIFSKNTIYHIGVLNSAITMPTKIINGTPHIGVEMGFSVPLKKDSKKQHFNVGVDAGYFYQKALQTATYLKPNINYTIPITKNINIQPSIGVGVMATNNLNNEFKRNADGVYEKSTPLHLQAMGSLGVQPNFNVYNTKHYKYDAFLRYEFAMQGPFSAISPMLPLTMFHLGVNIKASK